MFDDQRISRKTLEFAERYADGLATRNELRGHAWGKPGSAYSTVLYGAWDAAEISAEYSAGMRKFEQPACITARVDEETIQTHLLRDILGDPFQPLKLNSLWLTSDVIDVAKSIYETKAFSQMPKLSDTLLDAGCNEPAIIHHCQSAGLHVRGCWVVDLLLGKE